MNQMKLSLENLDKLDFGTIGKVFDHHLKHVVKDCEDRPLEKGTRKVSIEFILTPDPDIHGKEPVCDSIDVACDVKSSVPKVKTRVYSMKPKADGSLAFNPDVPEDADAEGLYDRPQKESA